LYGVDIDQLFKNNHFMIDHWYCENRKSIIDNKINQREFILNITKSMN